MTGPLCPKCRRTVLAPTTDVPVPAELSERPLKCEACQGLWLPHVIVESWRAHPISEQLELEAEPAHPSVPPEADHRTGLCPFGHGILIRARVDGPRTFYVERCSPCRGVWLDRGEWKRLASARFLEHLDDLWDPNWKRQNRVALVERHIDAALTEELGQELFSDLQAVVSELHGHPARAQALAWIVEHLERELTHRR